ncbi:MAG: prepilin-type N-terminal cleavage/methylation domain-containing protein [Verrucomicrobiae bacterium]|nr:prepilin-type N-terminal cleavage/methylation domain-containing protein [Verrucomicrobiae bacterium]
MVKTGRGQGRRGLRQPGAAGFTMIELLVAMAIVVLMMMTAIPYLRSARKNPLVQATHNFVEACRQARVKAILTGRPMQVVIYDGGAALGVEAVPNLGAVGRYLAAADPAFAAEVDQASIQNGAASVFQARMDDEVAFRRPLLINGRDFFDSVEQAAAIRFFPNGTSDALQCELQWLRQDVRRITLDVMTGQPVVEGVW